MKKLFFVAIILLPTLTYAQDVEKVHQLLNDHPRFDRLKEAATGNTIAAQEEVGRFITEYCELTKKCSWLPKADLALKGNIGVQLAKIRLKTIEQANRKYAEALVEFNKQLSACQEQPSVLFSQEFKEGCSEEIVCTGKKAEELRDLLKDFHAFEKRIGVTHRELSEEEKMVFGADISPMLNKPVGEDLLFDKTIDAAYPIFSMAPKLENIHSYRREKKLFTTKLEKSDFKVVRFDDNFIADGIMTLRALNCEDETIIEGDKVKKDEFACRLYVGNQKVDIDSQKDMKSCLKKDHFLSFKNLFKKKSNSKNINDSERDYLKEVSTKKSEPEMKAGKVTEQ
jgi:hypothetical protein